MKRIWWAFGLVGLLLLGFGVLKVVGSGSSGLAPLRAALNYPYQLLVAEAETMNECAECHQAEEFHTCATCHDDHGSAELAAVPFDDLLLLTGDVPGEGDDKGPTPRLIPINDILPYRDQPNTHVTLLDFLAQQGVTDFESVTLGARDGGFVTVERRYVTDEALLMPHVDGLRFAAENLHVSTWLRGVYRMIVVGVDRPLVVNGRATSIGRLLLGPTRSLTIEQTEVMLKSQFDGQISEAQTATRLEGVATADIIADQDYSALLVSDGNGEQHELIQEEAAGALLTVLPGRSGVMLVLPERGRAQWVTGVVEIEVLK